MTWDFLFFNIKILKIDWKLKIRNWKLPSSAVAFFFHLIHHILGQFAVAFDHISNKSKNEQLDTDDEENARGEEVVQIRSDFETTAKVLN